MESAPSDSGAGGGGGSFADGSLVTSIAITAGQDGGSAQFPPPESIDGMVTIDGNPEGTVGAIVEFKLSAGIHPIVVTGAQGGFGGVPLNLFFGPGGAGAEVSGLVDFAQPTALDILVGQAGGPSFDDPGGGGGSFVWMVPVPEPSTWAMLVFGFAGLGLAGWRARGVVGRTGVEQGFVAGRMLAASRSARHPCLFPARMGESTLHAPCAGVGACSASQSEVLRASGAQNWRCESALFAAPFETRLGQRLSAR